MRLRGNTPRRKKIAGTAVCRVCFLLLSLITAQHVFSQARDSITVLKAVQVGALKKRNDYTASTPVQSLDRQALQQINAQSVGDAARYFSGVIIKDYGGIGGLKTISVRSLGAAATGIVYDGIPVADLQTGQVDLSRFSATFVQSLTLQQGAFQYALSPARTYASAATLAIATNTFQPTGFDQHSWQAGIKAGSFNLWQPFAGIYLPLKKRAVISINTEAVFSKGNYPVYIDNGSYSAKTNRDNSAVKSIQGEASLLKQFKDSSTLQVKAAGYSAARGLPGAIVFFNNRSVQRLRNEDVFAQSRYQKKIDSATMLLAVVKYSRTYTRYTDPDYLNNQGGLDNRYTQQELYAGVAASRYLPHHFLLSGASDIAWNGLTANLKNFAEPVRNSLWEHLALAYIQPLWQINGGLLYTGINDKTNSGTAAGSNSKFTPAAAFSVRPGVASPLLFRLFYKAAFRMPTFNDLYYNLVGNVSLKPEYSKQFNAGVTYTRQYAGAVKKFSVSADVYYNEVKDKIIAVPNQNLFVWTMLNLGSVHIKGIDINAETGGKLNTSVAWFFRAAYTWQQALDVTDKSSATYNNKIPYTPDNAGSALLSFTYKKCEAGYSLLFSGTRFTLGQNNPYNQLPGWLTQDVFIARTIACKHFNLHIRAEADNLFDARYDIVRYFPMPGRSYMLSLSFNHL